MKEYKMEGIVKTSAIAAFLNTSPSKDAETWARFRKQNELKIKYDAEVSEEKYIDEDGPTSEIENYKVSFDGEYTAYKNDPVFNYLDDLRQSRATGTAAETDVLLVYVYDSEGSAYSAERSKASITITDFGGEGGGGKAYINYTVNLNGNPERGTCTIADGKPSFTKSA